MTDPAEIIHIGDFELRWLENENSERQWRDREDRIEAIWREGLARHPDRLFDGEILNLDTMAMDDGVAILTGRFIHYRYFYAGLHLPELNLGIRPIALSGITIIENEGHFWTVFAKRARHTSQYPGYLELVPSGTIDKSAALGDGTIDYRKKLAEEFHEEADLPGTTISKIHPLGIVFDNHDSVYDACCVLRTNAERSVIVQGILRGDEYEEPVLVHLDDLPLFVKAHSRNLTPASRGIISAFEKAPTEHK